jgi:hypothetical protein
MTEQEVTEAEYDTIFGSPAARQHTAGGDVSEAQYDAAFGLGSSGLDSLVSFDRNVDDLKRVGLPSDIAEKAARELAAGMHDSFEAAALMASALVRANGKQIAVLDANEVAAVIQERKEKS